MYLYDVENELKYVVLDILQQFTGITERITFQDVKST